LDSDSGRYAMNDISTSAKVECSECRAEILVRTATATGGLCMPCSTSAHSGWTPHQCQYFDAHGLRLIADRASRHYSNESFRGLGGIEVGGHSTDLLASDVFGCVSSALRPSDEGAILNDERRGWGQTLYASP